MTHTAREIVPGYEVTPEGRVYSISYNWRGYGKREMQQCPNRDGYLRVQLTVNGIRKIYYVHKLVALTFLPANHNGDQIRHLDGNRQNNSLSNLAWGTAKENAEDRERHGKTSKGTTHSLYIKNGFARRTK